MKRSSNTDGDKSSPDKKAKATQSSSLETQKFFSDSSSSSSSSSSSPMQEELQKYEEAAKKTKQIEVEQDRLRELKEIEMRKLIRLFVNRPYKPYSSDESFYNALQLTNLVVGVRRNCKYAKELSRAPPYSYLKDTTNPRNYYMSKNELHAHMALQNLVDYQAVRNRPNGIKKLRRKVALRGEFVQTNHIQQWECGFCKQPIAPAVTSCHTATTFPSWTRCEQEENNICLNNAYSSKTSRTEEEKTSRMLSAKTWCRTCVEKECQRVVGIDENESNRRANEHASLRTFLPHIFRDESAMSGASFFSKLMEVVGDIVDPYSLTQELYKAYVKDSTRLDQMLEEYQILQSHMSLSSSNHLI